MTEAEAMSYIMERGQAYDLSFDDMMNMIPRVLHDDLTECAEFVEIRDISHILPQSTHPELTNDPLNMILEDPSVNRARGADPMSELEEMTAMLDNEIIAAQIDLNDIHIDIIPDYIPLAGII